MQVSNRPKFAVQSPYPSLHEHAQDGGEEDDAKARKEECIDNYGIRRWGEYWGNIWKRSLILHDAGLIEEDVLDCVEGVLLEEIEGLNEKGRKKRGENCRLGRIMISYIDTGDTGMGVQIRGRHREVPATRARARCLQSR